MFLSNVRALRFIPCTALLRCVSSVGKGNFDKGNFDKGNFDSTG